MVRPSFHAVTMDTVFRKIGFEVKYNLVIMMVFCFTDTRETAFITALTSAALTYRMTSACTKGEVTNCGCLDGDSYISSYDLLKAVRYIIFIYRQFKFRQKPLNFLFYYSTGGKKERYEA